MSPILLAASWFLIGFSTAVITMSFMAQHAARKNREKISAATKQLTETMDRIMAQHGFTQVKPVEVKEVKIEGKAEDGSAPSPIQFNPEQKK